MYTPGTAGKHMVSKHQHSQLEGVVLVPVSKGPPPKLHIAASPGLALPNGAIFLNGPFTAWL